MPDNRVALLVGAGDAIGAAVARRFARGGYRVCLARREAAKSQGLLDEAKASGLDIRAFSVDARNEAEVQGLFARVEAEARAVRVLRDQHPVRVIFAGEQRARPNETKRAAQLAQELCP